jgi:hypothetical protein
MKNGPHPVQLTLTYTYPCPSQIECCDAHAMSETGQTRRFDGRPATSGLPRTTDFVRPAGLVRFVPFAD